jgi:ribonuclease-3
VTTSESSDTAPLVDLERRINIRFRDRELLRLALCHTSYVNERPDDAPGSNERLEFLGDAIVGVVMADWLYRALPNHSEGDLTVIRSTLVREETLARWASEIDLGEHLLLGRGEIRGGGRVRPALLARAFEALIGAIYLEHGDKAVRTFLLPFFEREMRERALDALVVDAKSRLQQLSQVVFNTVPRYRVIRMGGLEHAPIFTCAVLIKPDLEFQGSGRTKRLAEQEAATLALNTVEEFREARTL